MYYNFRNALSNVPELHFKKLGTFILSSLFVFHTLFQKAK